MLMEYVPLSCSRSWYKCDCDCCSEVGWEALLQVGPAVLASKEDCRRPEFTYVVQLSILKYDKTIQRYFVVQIEKISKNRITTKDHQ